MPWNGASPFADKTSRMQNWMSGAPLFTLVIFVMKVDNITLMMFVLNFVLFLDLFTLASDFHEGRQYYMFLLVLNFAF